MWLSYPPLEVRSLALSTAQHRALFPSHGTFPTHSETRQTRISPPSVTGTRTLGREDAHGSPLLRHQASTLTTPELSLLPKRLLPMLCFALLCFAMLCYALLCSLQPQRAIAPIHPLLLSKPNEPAVKPPTDAPGKQPTDKNGTVADCRKSRRQDTSYAYSSRYY
ncbi:hypothetical protein LY78DRAFT_296514 [Colletotrichum sublineola]|nr:hypothetical protein LY78DRAFT_296514 [Colletotrichum sublineola]